MTWRYVTLIYNKLENTFFFKKNKLLQNLDKHLILLHASRICNRIG